MKTRLYAISPSGAIEDRDRMLRAAQALEAAGHPLRFDRSAFARSQRFAGSDRQRLAAFARAQKQPAPIVIATRGGYGLSRLLPALDWKALAATGKHWVGVSDFTAFHLGMLACAGAATWAGPALVDFAPALAETAPQPDSPERFTFESFVDAMSGALELVGFRFGGPAPRSLDVRGTLWGGNLTMVCSLLGTPWFPKVRKGILFLEEVHEHPYRIERMLLQLLHAGVLDTQQAVLIGHVSRYRVAPHDAGYDLKAVLDHLRSLTRVPILTGLPYGHEHPVLTLPHGVRVGLAVQGRTAWLQFPHASHTPLADNLETLS